MNLRNLLEIEGIHRDGGDLIVHVGGEFEETCVAITVAILRIRVAHALKEHICENPVPLVPFSGRLYICGGHDCGPACCTSELGDGGFLGHAAHGHHRLRERSAFARIDQNQTLTGRNIGQPALEMILIDGVFSYGLFIVIAKVLGQEVIPAVECHAMAGKVEHENILRDDGFFYLAKCLFKPLYRDLIVKQLNHPHITKKRGSCPAYDLGDGLAVLDGILQP